MMKIFAVALSILIALAVSGCSDGKDSKKQVERAVNVSVAKVEKKGIRPFIEATGSITAFDESIVSSEIDGIVKRVLAEEGNPVKKGALLAEIDDTDLALEVKRSEAAYKQAQATFSNTKVEFERKKALLKDELITRQQFDDVEMRLALAEAEIEKSKASLNLTRQRLSKTRIYSPISGFVKTKKATAGDFVKVGSNIYTIIQNNPIKLLFTVNEKDLPRIKVGQDVSFTVDNMPGREFKAQLHSVYPNVDEKTRSITVEGRLANESGELRPGLFAKVSVFTEGPRDAVLIPITSILYEADKMKVFVVEGEQAKMRFLKTGGKYSEFIEVTEGVKEGENIVTVGQQNLSEGVKVNVAR